MEKDQDPPGTCGDGPHFARPGQLLHEHLFNVSCRSESFAETFNAGHWGRVAGLWHDLGKFSNEFQRKLTGQSTARVDHSTAGARHAYQQLGASGKILAYAIAGHHSGLPNGKSNDEACLALRLETGRRRIPDYSDHENCPQLSAFPSISPAITFKQRPGRTGFQLAFFTRMLFSCLVDADRLDAEAAEDRDKAARRGGFPTLKELDLRLKDALRRMSAEAPDTSINRERTKVLSHCLDAAILNPGIFSLTVPTGGGKTLSSLAFAIRHALNHGHSRIIYVIPFTSIIEQNAEVFRNILGPDAVIEHHSNFEQKTIDDDRPLLSAENWDAPLIVTTNVQFFESLFSAKASRCRRLHNISRSVVILDEAQMLPIEYLRPCLEAVQELALNYGASIILCTATQPALKAEEDFKGGLPDVREIIPDPKRLYTVFQRVRTTVLPALTEADLAERLKEFEQVLCIVQTRRAARTLFERIRTAEGACHLSALMCPAHRTQRLQSIRDALKNGGPCRVVSTSLVEAGVDIDFPVVFRSISGIDSIAQAAGRCNREGKLPDMGQVFVFEPELDLPPGPFRRAAETATPIIRKYGMDLLCLDAVREYFRQLYWRAGEAALDARGILGLLSQNAVCGDFPFREVSEAFRLIEDFQQPVIIAFDGKASRLITELQHAEKISKVARQLQRFAVSIHSRQLQDLISAGAVEEVREGFWVLRNKRLYRNDVGLDIYSGDPSFHDPEDFMA